MSADLANGNFVSQSDAVRQRWRASREVLVETAGEYGAWITEEQFSTRIQARIGITIRQELPDWIDRVLELVAADAEQRGEPRLTSVWFKGEWRIGEGYAGVPAGIDERTRERVAAEDRLERYRFFGASMPDDGGSPTVLAPLRDRPVRQPRTRSAPRTARIPAPAPGAARDDLPELLHGRPDRGHLP